MCFCLFECLFAYLFVGLFKQSDHRNANRFHDTSTSMSMDITHSLSVTLIKCVETHQHWTSPVYIYIYHIVHDTVLWSRVATYVLPVSKDYRGLGLLRLLGMEGLVPAMGRANVEIGWVRNDKSREFIEVDIPLIVLFIDSSHSKNENCLGGPSGWFTHVYGR